MKIYTLESLELDKEAEMWKDKHEVCVHADIQSLAPDMLYCFDCSTWLAHPSLPKPELTNGEGDVVSIEIEDMPCPHDDIEHDYCLECGEQQDPITEYNEDDIYEK